MTKAAIVSFQRRRGLSVDGVVGPQTRRAFGKRLLFRTRARSIEPPVRAAFSPDGRYFVDHDLNLWRLDW